MLVFAFALAISGLLTAPSPAQEEGGGESARTSPPESSAGAGPADGSGAKEASQFWTDFNHYVLIARPKLAAAAGKALLQQVESDQLLKIIEDSRYDQWQRNLERARQMEGVAEVARQLTRRIQQSRIDLARNSERITRNIELLDQGQRRYVNAIERLRAAGQFAVPQLLSTLENEQKARLHPYVMSALTSIGQEAVYPLTVALPELPPETMAQVVQVLARIGYPRPLAVLKRILEKRDLPSGTQQTVLAAYRQLRRQAGVPADRTAAQLFLALGRNQYTRAVRGKRFPDFDPARGRGIVWEYVPNAGLVEVPVPGEIYGEVLAMRSARSALQLQPRMGPALSLFLMANLRRENQLPRGETDPSYPRQLRPAEFYAMLAGPERLHDVLTEAVHDRDTALALDAITTLAQTAGTEALVREGAGMQPLLEALSYPSRRVRFHAAVALAEARPTEEFPRAYRVVPVLAEAVNAGGPRRAMVLGENQAQVNRLLARLGEMGFQTFGGPSLDRTSEQWKSTPGLDLIVLRTDSADRVRTVLEQTGENNRLASKPILAVIPPSQQFALSSAIERNDRLAATTPTGENQGQKQNQEQDQGRNQDQQQQSQDGNPASARTLPFAQAVRQLTGGFSGEPISDARAKRFAMIALDVLHNLALAQTVYRVQDAQPALMQALGGDRTPVITGAGDVLSLLNDSRAQRALADAALSASGDLRLALLEDLAQSATRHGGMLSNPQVDRLQDLVRDGSGRTAIAAARAHGALSLPTSRAVEMIVQHPSQPNAQ